MIEDVKKILDEYVLNKPTIVREATFGYTDHIHPLDTKNIAQQICQLFEPEEEHTSAWHEAMEARRKRRAKSHKPDEYWGCWNCGEKNHNDFFIWIILI